MKEFIDRSHDTALTSKDYDRALKNLERVEDSSILDVGRFRDVISDFRGWLLQKSLLRSLRKGRKDRANWILPEEILKKTKEE